MLLKHPFGSVLFLTTSLLVGATAIAEPSRAATFALSEAEFSFDDFNQTPFDIVTDTDTDAVAIETNGVVEAVSDADALFEVDPPSANNFFFNGALGDGLDYEGFAESEALLLGSFEIAANSTFSFNFSGFLALLTEIDDVATESASAFGSIAFGLFDVTNPDASPIQLDFFELVGNLDTPGSGDFLDLNNSEFIALNNQTDLSTNFGGEDESAIATVSGSYSRYFEEDAVISLFEIKQGEVSVRATPDEEVSVPEPTSVMALVAVVGSSLVWSGKSASRKSKTRTSA